MTAVPAVSRPAASRPEASGPAAAAAVIDADDAVVDVLFPIVDHDQWPPYPAENVEAVLLAHDLAEIRSVPWFLTDLSRGDIVQVEHDGIGYVGRTVVGRSGHSTVHVLAATQDELAPVARNLQAVGAEVLGGLEPPMLAVDVPISVPLEDVLEVLIAAESVTCAHEVASNQHPKRARARTVA
jgi:Domain of unknown function (DUF4265)